MICQSWKGNLIQLSRKDLEISHSSEAVKFVSIENLAVPQINVLNKII